MHVRSLLAILANLIMFAGELAAPPVSFSPISSKRGSKTVLGFNQNAFSRCGVFFNRLPDRTAVSLVATAMILASAGCNSIASRGMNSAGVRLFEQARYDEALEQFREASFVGPTDPDGYYNLAATYHRTGRLRNRPADIAQAEKYYRMCFDRDPNHPECHRGLAVLLAEEGREDEAFALIEDWVDRQPGLPDPQIELARLTNEFGDRETAKEHLLEALAIDPDNPRTLRALGSIREGMGDKAQALVDYKRSLRGDRYQPQVASRIAALQPAGVPTVPTSAPDAPAQLVERDGSTLR